jgi:antitoxin YefM
MGARKPRYDDDVRPSLQCRVGLFLAKSAGSSRRLLTLRTIFRTIQAFQRRHTVAVLTASKARANLYRLIDQTAESHQPIIIAGKRSSAVLVSEEDWQAIQETMFLLSIPGMRKSIRDAMAEPLSKSAKELNW